jgi:hypothetical protein
MRQRQGDQMHSLLSHTEQVRQQGGVGPNYQRKRGCCPAKRGEQIPRKELASSRSRCGRTRRRVAQSFVFSTSQYSSASMIVITRSVTEGSDGSGDW